MMELIRVVELSSVLFIQVPIHPNRLLGESYWRQDKSESFPNVSHRVLYLYTRDLVEHEGKL